MHIYDPGWLTAADLGHLVFFAAGDIVDHSGILMFFYWDMCSEAVACSALLSMLSMPGLERALTHTWDTQRFDVHVGWWMRLVQYEQKTRRIESSDQIHWFIEVTSEIITRKLGKPRAEVSKKTMRTIRRMASEPAFTLAKGLAHSPRSAMF